MLRAVADPTRGQRLLANSTLQSFLEPQSFSASWGLLFILLSSAETRLRSSSETFVVRLQKKHASFSARRLQPSLLTGILPTLFLAQDDAPPPAPNSPRMTG